MIKRRNFREGFGIEDDPGLYRRIYNIIRDNHINAEIIDTDDSDDYGFAEISIDGDWKHDHLRLKYLLEQEFDTVIWREINTYPSDSDSYEAEYQIYLADPKDSTFTESAIRKSVKGRRYERYNRNSKNSKTMKRNMLERIDRKISPQLVSIKNLARAIYNLQKNDGDRAYLSAYGIESLEVSNDFMEDYVEVNIYYEDGDTVNLYIYNDASGKGTGKPLYRMTSNFEEIESGNGVQLVTLKDVFRYANIV